MFLGVEKRLDKILGKNYLSYGGSVALSAALPFLVLNPIVRSSQVLDIHEAPDLKIGVVPYLCNGLVPELADLIDQVCQLRSLRLGHPSNSSEPPRDDIGNYISELDTRGHLTMDEKRLRDDPCGAPNAFCVRLEIVIHLIKQNLALSLFQFVEDNYPHFLWPDGFEEIEETFEQIRIVLSQDIGIRLRRILINYTCEGSASESRTNVQYLPDVIQLCLGQCRDLPSIASLALV